MEAGAIRDKQKARGEWAWQEQQQRRYMVKVTIRVEQPFRKQPVPTVKGKFRFNRVTNKFERNRDE